MNQEVGHNLPTTIAHTTPTHDQVTPLDEVLRGKNFPPSSCTHKKQNTPRSLSPSYILEKLHFIPLKNILPLYTYPTKL